MDLFSQLRGWPVGQAAPSHQRPTLRDSLASDFDKAYGPLFSFTGFSRTGAATHASHAPPPLKKTTTGAMPGEPLPPTPAEAAADRVRKLPPASAGPGPAKLAKGSNKAEEIAPEWLLFLGDLDAGFEEGDEPTTDAPGALVVAPPRPLRPHGAAGRPIPRPAAAAAATTPGVVAATPHTPGANVAGPHDSAEKIAEAGAAAADSRLGARKRRAPPAITRRQRVTAELRRERNLGAARSRRGASPSRPRPGAEPIAAEGDGGGAAGDRTGYARSARPSASAVDAAPLDDDELARMVAEEGEFTRAVFARADAAQPAPEAKSREPEEPGEPGAWRKAARDKMAAIARGGAHGLVSGAAPTAEAFGRIEAAVAAGKPLSLGDDWVVKRRGRQLAIWNNRPGGWQRGYYRKADGSIAISKGDPPHRAAKTAPPQKLPPRHTAPRRAAHWREANAAKSAGSPTS